MDGTGDIHVVQNKPDSERKKISYYLSYAESRSTEKERGPGVVVYTYNPSYSGRGGVRIAIQGLLRKKQHKVLFEKQTKAKRAGACLK
jgi:hypothetical protein